MAPTNLQRRDFVLNAHLHSAWARAALEGQDPYLIVSREERVFGIVGACDPTEEGRYLTWLSTWRRRQWKEFGLRYICSGWELGELSAALIHFDRIRHRLPSEHRDIGRYKTAAEIASAEISLPRAAKDAFEEEERQVALAQSTVLFDDGLWKAVRLNGQKAASWWGRGTRWCTAARSSNHYETYSRQGALIILITPTGRFQLAASTGEFRDASDAHADLEKTLRTSPTELKKLLLS